MVYTVKLQRFKRYFNNQLKGKRIAIWGLSFKPDTDDIRESPSLVIINSLLKAGVQINAYDPAAMDEVKKVLGSVIEYSSDPYDATIDADALVLVTEWREFRVLNYGILKNNMKNKVIFDGRNIYEPKEVLEEDFDYICIGRNTSKNF